MIFTSPQNLRTVPQIFLKKTLRAPIKNLSSLFDFFTLTIMNGDSEGHKQRQTPSNNHFYYFTHVINSRGD